jgi:4-hydroxyphenylacetate 3-monooxygenase
VTKLRDVIGGTDVFLADAEVVVAGYTGRDPEAVQAHIAELAHHGVPAPDSVPAFYPVGIELLATAPGPIDVAGDRTSGEAEPVIVRLPGGELYVTIGSDHTDRELERTSIPLAKRACPKVMSTALWPLAAVEEGWDDLVLASDVGPAAVDYQRGTLAGLRRPREILAMIDDAGLADAGRTLVVFLGTVPLIGGDFSFAPRFRARLIDERRGRELAREYDARVSANGARTSAEGGPP